MSQFNKKNKEIEELKERLHKQKSILDELSNQNNASIQEEKGDDLGKAEETEVNQESQQIPEIEQLKKQKATLFGKLFRAMSLINKKNKEIESLSERLNKQKAIIEELTSTNSENLAIEMEPQNLINQEPSQDFSIIKDNEVLQFENKQLKQQFDALQIKHDTLEQKFNDKIIQFQSLIESLLKQNQDDIDENNQLTQFTKASNKVIKFLHQKQQEQNFESSSSSSSISIQDESQQQIPYLQNQVIYFQHCISEYVDGISQLNRRILELYNKNMKLEAILQKENLKSSLQRER